jgi:hypothetical protein
VKQGLRNENNTYTKNITTKTGFISTRQVNLQLALTSSRLNDIKIKDGAQKAEKGKFTMEQLNCPSKIPFTDMLKLKDP